MSGPPPKFHGVSDLREFFRTNQTPIYFVSPTAFNLLGMDRWVRNFHYVTYFDSFEGSHPNVFVPEDRRAPEFESIEDICNYLLRHPEVLSFTAANGAGGRVVFVMFDEETEELAARAGLQVAHPPAVPSVTPPSSAGWPLLPNSARPATMPAAAPAAVTARSFKPWATGESRSRRFRSRRPTATSGI